MERGKHTIFFEDGDRLHVAIQLVLTDGQSVWTETVTVHDLQTALVPKVADMVAEKMQSTEGVRLLGKQWGLVFDETENPRFIEAEGEAAEADMVSNPMDWA